MAKAKYYEITLYSAGNIVGHWHSVRVLYVGLRGVRFLDGIGRTVFIHGEFIVQEIL